MSSRGYTVLGWIVWQIGKRAMRRELTENRAKIGAVATIALVLIGGILAARATNGE